MFKIALYTANFGDYRQEFQLYYNVKFDKNIDYFIFTDKKCSEDEMSKLMNWKICNINTLEGDDIMDKFRWTSKYVKFVLPELLKDYDIIVWVDNKRVYDLTKLTYEHIMKIMNKYPKCNVFNIKHPDRNTIQEELLQTINANVENEKPAKYFLKCIGNYKSKFDLPDTCIIIRRNNQLTNETFSYCLSLMKKYKLKRDQNIYNLALDEKNIKPVILDWYTVDIKDNENTNLK